MPTPARSLAARSSLRRSRQWFTVSKCTATIDAAGGDSDLTYTTPPAVDAAGGLPPAELANYLVAHYGYASPLVSRSVVAGLIAEPGVPASVEAAAGAELPPAP